MADQIKAIKPIEVKPIKAFELPEIKPIETDSAPKRQSLQEWHAAGGGIPMSHKDRPDVWHSKVQRLAGGGEVYNTEPDMSDGGQLIDGPAFAAGGGVHMGKGGKMGVGLKIADAVADANRQADAIIEAQKAAKAAGRVAFEQQAPTRAALTAQAAEKMAKMPARSKQANLDMGLYHPVGGGLKLSKPTWAMHSTTVPDPAFNPPPIGIITPEQLVKEEAALFPLVGDRAAAGRYLTHVGENELERPVRLTGGPRYMDANYNIITPDESAAWESGLGRVTALGKQAMRAGEGGRPVYGVYTAGSGTNTDFNVMGANALLQQIPYSKISKKAEREFDRAMRTGTEGSPAIPNWPGIRSPEAQAMLLDKSNGIARTKLFEVMGKENFQSMGFPDVPATRRAIIEPELLDVPTNQAGYRLARMDTTGRVIQNPLIPSDYPTAMAGRVAGQLDVPADYKDIWQSHFNARRLLSQPESGDYYSFSRAHPIQYANDEWLNKLMEQRFANERKIREGSYKEGGAVEEHFDGGGLAAADFAGSSDDDDFLKARLVAKILAEKAKEQAAEEGRSMSQPRSVTDVLNRGVVAPLIGTAADIGNLALEGVDYLRGKASGKPVEKRLASDRPFMGTDHIRDLMREYGMTTDTERPMMETGLSIISPGGALKGAVKGAEALPKAGRAVEGGLNAATAAMRRPFTPATVTMEAVAPDLAKYKPRDWQETATRRLTGEGAPVSMDVMGGRKTTKRPGQGVYENFEGQLETNPLVAVDVPFAGSLSGNKALRADITTAGQELAQESVAAHRFVPMATNQIKDASAMLIGTKDGRLSNKEIIELGERLPGMIVAHNPRLGGIVVMPYDYTKGKVPTEFSTAQDVAKSVLGKRADFTYGKADPMKDRLYIERSDYVKEGARPPSAESKAMRERLQRAEERLFRAPAQSARGPRQGRAAPATTAD